MRGSDAAVLRGVLEPFVTQPNGRPQRPVLLVSGRTAVPGELQPYGRASGRREALDRRRRLQGGAGLDIQILRTNVEAGTYAVGPEVNATYTPDGRTGQSAGVNWVVGGSHGGTGSVTVSSVSGSRVAGSFTFEMVPGGDNPSRGTTSVQGTFDVPFGNSRIC